MSPFSEDEWLEISSEMPSRNDAFLRRYLAGRDALIAEEKKQRSDHAFRQALSPTARQACKIVDAVRHDEFAKIWSPDLEEQLARRADVIVYPGMMFALAKGIMEKTKLWHIISRMPKGCLLHAHLEAMVNLDYLLDVVLATPGMHIAAADSHLATPELRAEASVSVRFREGESTAEPGSIWTGGGGYRPGTFVLLTSAADAFPDGARDGFRRWLKSRCVLSQTDSLEQHHGQATIWRKFVRCFDTIVGFLQYEPVWRAYLRQLMSVLVKDGVSWVELRFARPMGYCREGSETPERDCNHMFQVLEDEINRFKATEEGKSFWGLRMIWSSLRSGDARSIIQDMENCITTKLAWPHRLAGYDLVGPEDAGRPLADLLPELFWFRKQCADEGVELPLFLHAGETLGDGNAADTNLFDAVLLGSRRLGHAFSLYKHPRLVQAVRDRHVLVESCPISNEVLRLTSSVMAHPLPALLSRGVPCALSNDDPAVLAQDTAGTTHDFWQALQGWENLGLAGLGSLAENSVRWAAFEDQNSDAWVQDVRAGARGDGVKARRLKEWHTEWEQFCQWIVDTYGDDYSDGGTDKSAVGEAE